jgi:hypothetical protein
MPKGGVFIGALLPARLTPGSQGDEYDRQIDEFESR